MMAKRRPERVKRCGMEIASGLTERRHELRTVERFALERNDIVY